MVEASEFELASVCEDCDGKYVKMRPREEVNATTTTNLIESRREIGYVVRIIEFYVHRIFVIVGETVT